MTRREDGGHGCWIVPPAGPPAPAGECVQVHADGPRQAVELAGRGFGSPPPQRYMSLDADEVAAALQWRGLLEEFGPAGPTRDDLDRVGERMLDDARLWEAFDAALRAALGQVLDDGRGAAAPRRDDGPVR